MGGCGCMRVPVGAKDIRFRGATTVGRHAPPDLGVGSCPPGEQHVLLLLSHLQPQGNFFILHFLVPHSSCIVFIEIL